MELSFIDSIVFGSIFGFFLGFVFALVSDVTRFLINYLKKGDEIMDLKKALDILTTVLLALVPLALLLISYFWIYIPAEYIALATIVMAVISQYASNQRVKDSVETVKKWIRWDYLTTILLAAWPIIVAYQGALIVYVPPALTVIVTGIFGFVSQWVTEKRNANTEDTA